VFGAELLGRVPDPDGSVAHAEVRIGDSIVMLLDARAGWPPTPSFLRPHLADGPAVHARAVAAGARSVTEPTALFFGDVVSRVSDPWGQPLVAADAGRDGRGGRARTPRRRSPRAGGDGVRAEDADRRARRARRRPLTGMLRRSR